MTLEIPNTLTDEKLAGQIIQGFMFGPVDEYRQAVYMTWLHQQEIINVYLLTAEMLRENSVVYTILMTAFLKRHNWFNGENRVFQKKDRPEEDYTEEESADRLFGLLADVFKRVKTLLEQDVDFSDMTIEHLKSVDALTIVDWTQLYLQEELALIRKKKEERNRAQ
jgi:hypothetical protein